MLEVSQDVALFMLIELYSEDGPQVVGCSVVTLGEAVMVSWDAGLFELVEFSLGDGLKVFTFF